MTPRAPGPDDPPWIHWAWREYKRGVRELPGPQHNARIIYYGTFVALRPTDDETPWCADFVCAALENAGVRSTRSARAASYETWGVACGLANGAVCFFPPSDLDAGGSGHVGFYFDGQLLGGNQRNRVGWDPRDWVTCTACRWPDFR